LQRYDKDGDGKLNEQERAAFEKARRERSQNQSQRRFNGAEAVPPGITLEKDVVYGKAGDFELLLDIAYHQKTTPRRPATGYQRPQRSSPRRVGPGHPGSRDYFMARGSITRGGRAGQ
jgi:hypothetical protein